MKSFGNQLFQLQIQPIMESTELEQFAPEEWRDEMMRQVLASILLDYQLRIRQRIVCTSLMLEKMNHTIVLHLHFQVAPLENDRESFREGGFALFGGGINFFGNIALSLVGSDSSHQLK